MADRGQSAADWWVRMSDCRGRTTDWGDEDAPLSIGHTQLMKKVTQLKNKGIQLLDQKIDGLRCENTQLRNNQAQINYT